jgi:hypothetical protein
VPPFPFDPAASTNQNEEYTPNEEGPDNKLKERHGGVVGVVVVPPWAKVAALALRISTMIVVVAPPSAKVAALALRIATIMIVTFVIIAVMFAVIIARKRRAPGIIARKGAHYSSKVVEGGDQQHHR